MNSTASNLIWGAHACSVLANAFRVRELPDGELRFGDGTLNGKSSFWQNAKTSPPQAGAPRIVAEANKP